MTYRVDGLEKLVERSLSDPISLGIDRVKLENRISELFQVVRKPIYRYLLTVLDDPAVAEEVTQEAFLQLYRELHRGKSIQNVRAWLFRVAHNLAINRSKRRRLFRGSDQATWEELTRSLVDQAPDPEEGVLKKDLEKRLRAGIAKLSPSQRHCLVLRAEGFRYREIGEILRISISSVAEHLRRGLKKLMREIHE